MFPTSCNIFWKVVQIDKDLVAGAIPQSDIYNRKFLVVIGSESKLTGTPGVLSSIIVANSDVSLVVARGNNAFSDCNSERLTFCSYVGTANRFSSVYDFEIGSFVVETYFPGRFSDAITVSILFVHVAITANIESMRISKVSECRDWKESIIVWKIVQTVRWITGKTILFIFVYQTSIESRRIPEELQ